MEEVLKWTIGIMVPLFAPLLTLFDLPGNTIMLLTMVGMAFFDPDLYFKPELMGVMLAVYVFGEAWEFFVSLLGVKKQSISWFGVFCIGVGGFIGTCLGTGVLPILGSFVGGLIGAFAAAFLYEYHRYKNYDKASSLGWAAVKVRFFALGGKLLAAIILAILLTKLIFGW